VRPERCKLVGGRAGQEISETCVAACLILEPKQFAGAPVGPVNQTGGVDDDEGLTARVEYGVESFVRVDLASRNRRRMSGGMPGGMSRINHCERVSHGLNYQGHWTIQ
jgi:hypothetical protein